MRVRRWLISVGVVTVLSGYYYNSQKSDESLIVESVTSTPKYDPGYPFNGDCDQFATLTPPTPDEALEQTRLRVIETHLGPDMHDHSLLVAEVELTNPAGATSSLLKSWLEWEDGGETVPLDLMLSEQQPANYLSDQIQWVNPNKGDSPSTTHLAVMLPPGGGVHLVCLIPKKHGRLMVNTMMVDRSAQKERALEMPLLMIIERGGAKQSKPAKQSHAT